MIMLENKEMTMEKAVEKTETLRKELDDAIAILEDDSLSENEMKKLLFGEKN